MKDRTKQIAEFKRKQAAMRERDKARGATKVTRPNQKPGVKK